ncbi:MAG: hypothetical protein RSD57_07315 [Comamonas sp.]
MQNTDTARTPRLLSVSPGSTSGTLHSLSSRSKSKLKAGPEAIVVKNRDTKYTYAEFKPDPDGPFLNATMTEPYLGQELGYRK